MFPTIPGLAIVADAAPHRAAMSMKASYLQRGTDEERIGMDWVPESSRRSRVLPLYALIRTLGRDGIAGIVSRNCALARRMADRLSSAPGVTILNDVVLNQVLVQFTDDVTTSQVIAQGSGRRHLLGRRRVLAGQAGDAHLGVELVDDRGGYRSIGRCDLEVLPVRLGRASGTRS